jgi:hypothetical protein
MHAIAVVSSHLIPPDLPMQDEDGRPGRANVMMELRQLNLIELQKKLRGQVEREQEEIMGLGERAYRKLVRDGEKKKWDMARAVERLAAEKTFERTQAAKKSSWCVVLAGGA